MARVRAALATLAPELVRVHLEGSARSLLMLKADVSSTHGAARATASHMVFLPVLDPYIMGYRDRERCVDPEIADRVYDRGGNGTAAIVLDGKVVGVWDAIIGPEPAVRVHLFALADDVLLTRVRVQANRVGHFLFNRQVPVQRVASMPPLSSRPIGAYARLQGAADVATL